jgi:hypothetical protein
LTAALRFRLRRGNRTTRLTPASERNSATRLSGTRTKTAFNKVSTEPDQPVRRFDACARRRLPRQWLVLQD